MLTITNHSLIWSQKPWNYNLNREPAEAVSKCFSLLKVKDGANGNHRNTPRISRIKIGARRRDRAK